MRITPQPSRSQKGTIWGWYLPPVYGILWYCINSLTGDGLWFSIIMFIHKFMLKLLGIDLTHPHVCFLTRGNRMKQAPKPGFFWPWTKTGRCPTGIQTHKCGHQLWLGFNWAFCTMPGEGCMMIIYISQTAWSTWLLERILTRAWNRWLSQVVFRPWHVAICFTRAWNEWPCQAVFRPLKFDVKFNQSPERVNLPSQSSGLDIWPFVQPEPGRSYSAKQSSVLDIWRQF